MFNIKIILKQRTCRSKSTFLNFHQSLFLNLWFLPRLCTAEPGRNLSQGRQKLFLGGHTGERDVSTCPHVTVSHHQRRGATGPQRHQTIRHAAGSEAESSDSSRLHLPSSLNMCIQNVFSNSRPSS